ncbi:MAG TPA: epoxyqueuosine reductase QueH [bacterium]|nr:epoxyqueuosine reductase QueH [bacterium]HPN31824.1 epoxyqueuosine reductase QueH [bacterium]
MTNIKEKLLLHICCAPCATHSIIAFNENFSIEGFFYNPNIEPLDEYEKRINALNKLIEFSDIDLLIGNYDNARWRDFIKGFERDKEGGNRCRLCIKFRLDLAAKTALYRGIKKFSTTLSISPHKNLDMINEEGEIAAKKYGVNFVAVDLKKNNGFAKSVELSKKYGLYRQKYCGCLFGIS